MRFWSRQTRTTSGQVKPTQPHQRNHKQFNHPTIKQRRSFSSLIGEQEDMEKIPSISSMDIHAIEPTDPSRGGMDHTTRGVNALGLPTYTITNLTIDRVYNANSTSTAELADVLGTLIGDVQKALTDLDRRLRGAGL